jgi:hypothetical protein
LPRRRQPAILAQEIKERDFRRRRHRISTYLRGVIIDGDGDGGVLVTGATTAR